MITTHQKSILSRSKPNFRIGSLRNINTFGYTIGGMRAELVYLHPVTFFFLCASVPLLALSPYTRYSSQNVRSHEARHKRRGVIVPPAAFLCLGQRL